MQLIMRATPECVWTLLGGVSGGQRQGTGSGGAGCRLTGGSALPGGICHTAWRAAQPSPEPACRFGCARGPVPGALWRAAHASPMHCSSSASPIALPAPSCCTISPRLSSRTNCDGRTSADGAQQQGPTWRGFTHSHFHTYAQFTYCVDALVEDDMRHACRHRGAQHQEAQQAGPAAPCVNTSM